jgi:PEGA domain
MRLLLRSSRWSPSLTEPIKLESSTQLETDFLPVPDEEKPDEPKPSTNPLFSIESLRGPTPKPTISGPQEGSGVLPILARLTEPRPITPHAIVPYPSALTPPSVIEPPKPLASVVALEPLPQENSQTASTLFQTEPPKTNNQLDATLLAEESALQPPIVKEPPKPLIVKVDESRKSEPRRRFEPQVFPQEKASTGNSLWWILIVCTVIFAASAGAYLLWRSTNQTPEKTTTNKIIKEVKYTLRTVPSGASVLVNGQDMGRSPIELFFPVKNQAVEYKISVALNGYKEQQFQLNPTVDGEKSLTLERNEQPVTQPNSTPTNTQPIIQNPPKELTPAEKAALAKKEREDKLAAEKKAKEDAKKEREDKIVAEKKAREEPKKPREVPTLDPKPEPTTQP